MESSTSIPTVKVNLPYALRAKAANAASVMVTGRTIREIINALEQNYPGFQFNLCYETGELRPYVNIFVDRENIRYLQGLDTLVPIGATIYIMQSVAGG